MSGLTHVELVFIAKWIENWIRFGRISQEQILDRQRRQVSFMSGGIFAFVRWASNDFGTVVSRIDVILAVARGEPYSTVPYVRQVVRFSCAYRVGLRSSACCGPLRRWRLSASIPRTPRLNIGNTFTTG